MFFVADLLQTNTFLNSTWVVLGTLLCTQSFWPLVAKRRIICLMSHLRVLLWSLAAFTVPGTAKRRARTHFISYVTPSLTTFVLQSICVLWLIYLFLWLGASIREGGRPKGWKPQTKLPWAEEVRERRSLRFHVASSLHQYKLSTDS